MGIFEWMFDFNHDGKVDPVEHAMGIDMLFFTEEEQRHEKVDTFIGQEDDGDRDIDDEDISDEESDD